MRNSNPKSCEERRDSGVDFSAEIFSRPTRVLLPRGEVIQNRGTFYFFSAVAKVCDLSIGSAFNVK